jgi:hypothetical protein
MSNAIWKPLAWQIEVAKQCDARRVLAGRKVHRSTVVTDQQGALRQYRSGLARCERSAKIDLRAAPKSRQPIRQRTLVGRAHEYQRNIRYAQLQ